MNHLIKPSDSHTYPAGSFLDLHVSEQPHLFTNVRQMVYLKRPISYKELTDLKAKAEKAVEASGKHNDGSLVRRALLSLLVAQNYALVDLPTDVHV